jgi:TRAP-type uncharacterized transport system fused permease subunit
VLVPFVFVFSPSMLIMVPGFSWQELVVSTLACLVSITFFSAAFAGWFLAALPGWQRWLIGIAGLPMIVASPVTIALSLLMAAPVLAAQVGARRRARRLPAVVRETG